ncbi:MULTISPECIES: MFS transporter [unclassified Novosphingobium]|uniref:MFS transporter n=1 Tax=unclassified Novosphingobium TaxID=2644732 RepID=UPI00135B7D4F|nr:MULTISPECIES: MFS transporter [unclassified Novosphingobium]
MRTFIIAIACGLLAANLYYAQPLISAIGADLQVPDATLGLIVTVTQIGYCIGLLFVVPLADRVENRTLVCGMVAVSAVAMAYAGLARGVEPFFIAVTVAGLSSAGAQVLVPLAAHLAPEGRQGRVIGTVMAGLLTGIMLARPVSSALAGLGDWRLAFLVPSGLLAVLAVALWFMLPRHRGVGTGSYGAILRSMAVLLREEPLLRRRAFYQACLFCAFNLFWTAGPMMLQRRFGLSHEEIALFALAGAGGALAAPIAGRMADRGLIRRGTVIAMSALGLSFALTVPAVAMGSVLALAVLAILLDAGTQGNQVVSQNVVYALRPHARGRINAIYMSLMFVGGALGSAIAPLLYVRGGWTACAAAGTGMAVAAFLAFATERRPARV